MNGSEPIRAAALALGLAATTPCSTPSELAAAARRAGLPVETVLDAVIRSGGVEEVPETARAYVEMVTGAHSELVGDLAHDLRGPLSGMIGLIQTLRRRSLIEEQQREFLRRCETSCHRLEALIAEVAILAQLEAGAVEPYLEDLDVELVVSDTKQAASGSVTVDIEAALPPVRSDYVRVVQILGRLVEHALARAITEPRISARAGEGTVVIVVADNGPLISGERLRGLLARPLRLPGDPRPERTVLGLAIARELAEVLGARLSAESTPQSTRLLLELPVTK